MLSYQIRQALKLLRKRNVGEDFLDMLHDTVVFTLTDVDSLDPDDPYSVGFKIQFAALRARQRHHMRFHRILRAPLQRETRAATSLILNTPLDRITDHAAGWLHDVTRAAEVTEDILNEIWAHFETEDTDEIPESAIHSHEDECLMRHDLPNVLSSIDAILDSRSAEVLKRYWLDGDGSDVIAQDLGITPTRVLQISKSALASMQDVYAPETMTDDLRQLAAKERFKREKHRLLLRSVSGVNLARAIPFFAKYLTPLQDQVLRTRFLSSKDPVSLEEVARTLNLEPEVVLDAQISALDRLRAGFPATEDRDTLKARVKHIKMRARNRMMAANNAAAKTKPAAQKTSSKIKKTAAQIPAFARGPLPLRSGKISLPKIG